MATWTAICLAAPVVLPMVMPIVEKVLRIVGGLTLGLLPI